MPFDGMVTLSPHPNSGAGRSRRSLEGTMSVLPLYSTSAAVPSLDRILTVAPRRHASATVSSLHRSTGLLLNQPQCSAGCTPCLLATLRLSATFSLPLAPDTNCVRREL